VKTPLKVSGPMQRGTRGEGAKCKAGESLYRREIGIKKLSEEPKHEPPVKYTNAVADRILYGEFYGGLCPSESDSVPELCVKGEDSLMNFKEGGRMVKKAIRLRRAVGTGKRPNRGGVFGGGPCNLYYRRVGFSHRERGRTANDR